MRRQSRYRSCPTDENRTGSLEALPQHQCDALIIERKVTYLQAALDQLGSSLNTELLRSLIRYLTQQQQAALMEELLICAEEGGIAYAEVWRNEYESGRNCVSDALIDILRNDTLRQRGIARIQILLGEYLATVRLDPAVQKNRDFRNRLNEIRNLFNLTDDETAVLVLLFLWKIDNSVENMMEFLTASFELNRRTMARLQAVQPMAIITGLSAGRIYRALDNNSNLYRYGLVDRQDSIVSEVVEFLTGFSNVPLTSKYYRQRVETSLPIDFHLISRDDIEALADAYRYRDKEQGVNVLLYGPPGVGKTEAARSLAHHCNAQVYEILTLSRTESSEEDPVLFRYRAFQACQNSINPHRTIVIVDEADNLLNTSAHGFSTRHHGEKEQLNQLLDGSKTFTIWITNRTGSIDESTSRRFDYSIAFKKFTCSQRCRVWRQNLIKHRHPDLLTEDEIRRLAERYEVSAGGIDIAVRHGTRKFAATGIRTEVLPSIERVLVSHVRMLSGKPPTADPREADTSRFSLEGLNIKINHFHLLEVIEGFNRQWDENLHTREVRTMNILLYGPPGSGKTELAKYLARTLKRRLVVKRGSDWLDMYVGQTEKLIRQTFEEAQSEGAILFVDEADSFLGSREGAHRSWEVTQVNELLTTMESFQGMLICATNFRTACDSAAMRRFNLKVEFDYLTAEGNVIFYNLLLRPLIARQPQDRQLARIAALNGLTPGDFKVVRQRHVFMAHRDLNHGILINALQEELYTKTDKSVRKMGF